MKQSRRVEGGEGEAGRDLEEEGGEGEVGRDLG